MGATEHEHEPVECGRCLCSIWVQPLSKMGQPCERCGRAICWRRHHAERADRHGADHRIPRGVCHECETRAARQLESWRAAVSAGAPNESTLTAEPADTRGPSVLRRQRRRYRQRPTTWAPWAETVHAQLAELSPAVERVYLIGARPGRTARGVLDWARGDLPAGWHHSPRGHYLDGETPVLRYERDGRTVELHRAYSWWSADPADPDEAAATSSDSAWQLMAELIESRWDEGTLLATPSATGRYLVMRSLPGDHEWPALTDELQHLIRSTSGQGRIELLPAAEVEHGELHQWDGRFAYGSLCWGMPGGVPSRGSLDYDPRARGRYLVSATVPAGWTGPGILPHPVPGGGWEWPSEPGRTFAAWVDGAELALAHRERWPFTIRDSIVWPRYTSRGPLDTWAERLRACRDAVAARAAVGAVSDDVARLAAAGFRSILIQTIGAMHGRPHRVTRMSPDPGQVPAGADALRQEGDVYVWTESRPAPWGAMSRPEWSAAVWGRARARLLDAPTGTRTARAGALHLPAGVDVVAFRTDALYLTGDPGWPDDGAVGRFRAVRVIPGPVGPFTSHSDLLRVREAV